MVKIIKFKYGSFEQFNSLKTKDENTLYFIIDKQMIYKGNTLLSLECPTVEEIDIICGQTLYDTTISEVLF